MPKIVKITNLTDKEKEEWEKKLKANNTSVNLPTAKKNVDTINNQSTVRGNLPIKIANTNELENAKILSSNDIKAMEEAKRINKEIEKGGINATNAIIGNTLNSFSGGVQRGTAGIANAGMLPVAWALRKVDDIGQKLGVIPEENSIRNASDRILKESDRLASIGNYNSNINARLDNKGAQVIGNTFNTVGNMMPSIVANIVAPGSGTGILGISAGGSSAQENLNYNKSNQGRSIITGVLKGGLEALTEQITGGNAIAQTGGLDRFVVPGISRVKSKVLQRLLSKGYEFAGEILEEEVSDIGGYIIDKWINNKKMPGFKEAWENAGETAGMTFLSTALLNAFGLGGNTYNDVQEYMNNKQAKQWLDEATKQIKEEKLDKKIEEDIDAKLENRNKVLPIDEVIRQNNPNIQEANQENNYKLSLLEEINSSKMSNEEKMQMLELVENSNINEDTYNDIRETINQTNSLIEQQTISQENKKAQNDNILPMNTKQKYMKYKNDTNTYDATEVNEVLDTTPTNRNGKRTVKQWLQVANEIGTRLADKSDAEIERIAYKSWFDTQPTKSITRYDNQAKTNLPFIKLTADEWVDTISKAANEARNRSYEIPYKENIQNKNIENTQQRIIIDNNDNMITSARKYGYNFNDESIQKIQKALDRKGIIGQFNESYFADSNEGAKIIIMSNENGTTRKIVFNPNASEDTIIQEMAIHEFTHDIFAKRDKNGHRIRIGQELYDDVKGWLKQQSNYEEQLESIKEAYLRIKDNNGNYVFNEKSKGFNEMIEEEAIAKTLQQKFGTQEEINRLIRENRNIAQRFYDWIVNTIDTLKNINDKEYLFWKNVQKKFEAGFNEEGSYEKDINKYSIIDNIKGTKKDYGRGVLLNTDFFEGIKPRNWKYKLNEFIYNNLAGKTIDVYSENGKIEQISFAKANERVKKDGSKNSHKVLDKLPTSNNNIKNLSIVQVDELLQTSKPNGESKENTHQWLDSNGWSFRRTYLQTKQGRIYEATLNIAKTKDGRNILYDINKIKEVDDANVPSMKRPSRTSTSTNNSIPSSNENVNTTKYSINNTDSFNLPENVKDIKNMNEFLRKAISEETDSTWRERLKDAQSSGYSRIMKESPLQYKRQIVQQYLNYKMDSQGRVLSQEQQKYFKDSKVRDEDGKLLAVYHGTEANAGIPKEHWFTIFDVDKQGNNGSWFGNGFYFTSNLEHAQDYAHSKGNVYEVYLNIIKPYIPYQNGNSMISFQEDFKNNFEEANKIKGKLTGKQIQDILKNNGYDGIIIGEDIIAFDSNQIKNVDNTNPTSNPDIRYSISTSGEMQDSKGNKVTLNGETGSSDKTLLAIHNLTADKLQGVLDLGGFPVPSIAVTNQPHTNFGNISVIFNKNTIDPSLNEANKVYSRDAYTARTPTVVNKINENGLKEVSKNTGIEEWYLRENYKETRIEDAVEKLKRNEQILDKYLKEQGIEIEPIYKEFKGFTGLSQNSLQEFINNHKELMDLSYTDKYTSATYEKYYNDVHDLFVKDIMKEAKINKEKAESFYKDYPGFNHWDRFIKDLDTVQKLNGGQQLDEYAIKEAKEKAADIESKEYKKYVKDLISPMYGEKYVRNNKDYYTKTGTPRSFEQRYETYTLDNIVKIMNENKGTGQESTFGVGINEIAGDASKKFRNIEDIKNSENLLMTQNEEEHKKILDKYNSEFRDIESSILDKYSDSSIDGYVWREKAVEDAMKNVARKMAGGKKVTISNVLSQFEKNGIQINETQAQRTIDLIEGLSTLPTNYFEAKPQRAVGLDEIDVVVIPNDLDSSLKQELKDRGIKTIEYDSNSETERAEILKSLDEYKFSKETSFDDYISKRIGKEGTRTRFADLKLPKQENTSSNIKLPITKMAMNTKESDLGKIAEILNTPVQQQKPQQRVAAILKANLIDKGAVFEDISKKINNRELEAKWDSTLSSGAKGQYAIGNDRYEFNNGEKTRVSKSLESIIEEVGDKESEFQNYMYHQLNVDRMTLDKRFGIDNKPVFGKNVGAEYSRQMIQEYEKNNPEFKRYAQDVYDYLNANKQELVNSGVISEELSEHLAERYPHYVPIKRVGVNGNAIAVPLDTRRTGINAPLKKAKGGSQDIQPLFSTIADRTLQTYRASARNSFGVELKNSLDELNMLNNTSENVDIDDIIDTMADEEKNSELLKKGEKGQNPTFTVFENGNKITYDISEDMYDALKPKNELYTKFDNSKLGKAIQGISSFRRGLITEYNPIFSLTNAVKDAQDVLLNSQHAAKTYAKLPEAYAQILGKGYYYQEYMQNGGEQNSYFKDGDFEIKKKNTLPTKAANILKIPIEAISKVNNVIEMSPRLAEYIASRESGRSVETSMLDAARVTTNFKAGGDLTRFANRNGFTFLNAGVQGLEQNIRNIREAHQKGLKGYAVLATKMAIAGLPALLLNGLIWKDDDDYEDLQDYVKDNYYIIGKYGKGQFIRIPKGRVVSVIQKVLRNADEFINNKNKIDADEYASQFWKDLKEDVIFGIDNIAPNNPIENNILSPLFQAITNKTWYGGDLVPTRLQDKPAEEQYDETTDKFSKWLGGKIGVSPIKINYLLDQYTGGIGDVLLPMGTPQAENNAIEDKFTTNSVMKSRYPGEFFEKFDELNIKHNSEKATDEDQIKYKYFSTLRGDLSVLYKQKRDIQNSTMSDKEKKEELLEVQKQINDIAKEGLNEVKNIKISGNIATAGKDQYYRATNTKDGTTEWKKLTDEEVKKNKDISLKTYANYKEKVANETIKQRKAGTIDTNGSIKDRDQIQILVNSNYSNKEKAAIYENYINSKDSTFNIMQNTGININEYLKYKIQNFESDKQDDGTTTGKSVSGSKKAKVYDYVNKMNINYNQRLVLLGTQYKLSDTERTKLAQYVNNLKTSKANKLSIYEKLQGFTVYKDGRVTW